MYVNLFKKMNKLNILRNIKLTKDKLMLLMLSSKSNLNYC